MTDYLILMYRVISDHMKRIVCGRGVFNMTVKISQN